MYICRFFYIVRTKAKTKILSVLLCFLFEVQANPFIQMMNRRYADYAIDWVRHHEMLCNLFPDEALEVIRQIEEVAEITGCVEWRLRTQFFRLEIDDGRTAEEYFAEYECFSERLLQRAYELLEETKKAKLPQLELMVRRKIMEYYWFYLKDYEAAFTQGHEKYNLLQTVSSADIPEKMLHIIHIANKYFAFRDYQRAKYFFNKVLEDNDCYFTARQHARNGLAMIYSNFYKDFDKSDSLFFALMQEDYNNPQNRFGDVWDGIAQGNIGYNMFARGEYDQAIHFYENSLPIMLKHGDYGFAVGPAINLADIYLRQGNISEARRYLDLAEEFVSIAPHIRRTLGLYEVKSKYYASTGNQELSIAYMDSLLMLKRQYEEQYNAMILVRMEQKELAQHQQRFAMEMKMRRYQLLIILVAFIVTSALLIALLISYRMRNAAYRTLVHKSQQWVHVQR